jgi:hypothetical protein
LKNSINTCTSLLDFLMTEQLIIDLGDSPDDGTGDTLYEAFSKVNANFSYLYNSQGEILGNLVSLNPTQAEITAGTVEFGLQISFPNADTVDLFYDSTLEWLNPATGSTQTGAFKFEKNDSLVGIFTNSINTYSNQNLNLLSTGTGIVTVAGTADYEQQVFHYSFGTIDLDTLLEPKDPDALVNAQAMIDFVTAYYTSGYLEKIVALNNTNTQVIANTNQVQVVVDGSTVATFTDTETQLGQLVITDQITTEAEMDLVLNPASNVSISGKRITNVADPIDPLDAINLRTINDSALGSIIGVDLTTAPDGALLVYNLETEKFEATRLLINQEIDAGTY